jgi:hypothetical protein
MCQRSGIRLPLQYNLHDRGKRIRSLFTHSLKTGRQGEISPIEIPLNNQYMAQCVYQQMYVEGGEDAGLRVKLCMCESDQP